MLQDVNVILEAKLGITLGVVEPMRAQIILLYHLDLMLHLMRF